VLPQHSIAVSSRTPPPQSLTTRTACLSTKARIPKSSRNQSAPSVRRQEIAQQSDWIKSPVPLIEEYQQRQKATAQFPPEISESCIRGRVSLYEDHITAAIAATEKICGSCGRFIEAQDFQLSQDDPRLQPFRSGSDLSLRLDSCALVGSDYLFCWPCFDAISKWRPPKYSALNAVNVSLCQHYPCALQDLTLTEECLIARSHPIVSVLKLRPNGTVNPLAYNRLRGHVIVLPQDPGPLLDILPSAELKLYEKINVVWFGDRPPTAADLKPYLEVRKLVVYRALQWLRLYNKLYSQIVVNQDLLDSWADSFIPSDLENSIVQGQDDSEEREGYVADIGIENCENDMQEALDDQPTDPISTGCVYSDVGLSRRLPELRHVLAVLNLERERFEGNSASSSSEGRTSCYIDDVPVIRYISNGRSVLMNDWQDQEYFTGSFPTLFPLGFGGHLVERQERPVSVSLEKWAEWALSHHSRRYVPGFSVAWQQPHPLAVRGYRLTKTDLPSITPFCTWCMMSYNVAKPLLGTL